MFNFSLLERFLRYRTRIKHERNQAKQAKDLRESEELALAKLKRKAPANNNDSEESLSEQDIEEWLKYRAEKIELEGNIQGYSDEEQGALQRLDDLIEVQQKSVGFWFTFILSISAAVVSINTRITVNKNSNQSSLESLPSRVVSVTRTLDPL